MSALYTKRDEKHTTRNNVFYKNTINIYLTRNNSLRKEKRRKGICFSHNRQTDKL